jgi:hypothetical protein
VKYEQVKKESSKGGGSLGNLGQLLQAKMDAKNKK